MWNRQRSEDGAVDKTEYTVTVSCGAAAAHSLADHDETVLSALDGRRLFELDAEDSNAGFTVTLGNRN